MATVARLMLKMRAIHSVACDELASLICKARKHDALHVKSVVIGFAEFTYRDSINIGEGLHE